MVLCCVRSVSERSAPAAFCDFNLVVSLLVYNNKYAYICHLHVPYSQGLTVRSTLVYYYSTYSTYYLLMVSMAGFILDLNIVASRTLSTLKI